MADNEKPGGAPAKPRYGPDTEKVSGRITFGIGIIAAFGCIIGTAALYFLDDRVGNVQRSFNRFVGKFKKKASP